MSACSSVTYKPHCDIKFKKMYIHIHTYLYTILKNSTNQKIKRHLPQLLVQIFTATKQTSEYCKITQSLSLSLSLSDIADIIHPKEQLR